jgi:hypothetical protein
MANDYRTNGVEYKNEKAGVSRDFPMTPETWNRDFLHQAACYGVFLKANADTASVKSGLKEGKITHEEALNVVGARLEEIIARQSFERERAERTSVYVDDNLVTAIAKVHKIDLPAALAAYHKNVSAVAEPDWKTSGVKKAQAATVIQAILGRQPKIKAEYDRLVAAQNTAPAEDSALEL